MLFVLKGWKTEGERERKTVRQKNTKDRQKGTDRHRHIETAIGRLNETEINTDRLTETETDRDKFRPGSDCWVLITSATAFTPFLHCVCVQELCACVRCSFVLHEIYGYILQTKVWTKTRKFCTHAFWNDTFAGQLSSKSSTYLTFILKVKESNRVRWQNDMWNALECRHRRLYPSPECQRVSGHFIQ